MGNQDVKSLFKPQGLSLWLTCKKSPNLKEVYSAVKSIPSSLIPTSRTYYIDRPEVKNENVNLNLNKKRR